MRTPNATPEDAHQLILGNGYVVKFGKQTICYTAIASTAEAEAAKYDATAYRIVRGEDGKIYLDDVEYLPPTASEQIAAKISEEITGGRNRPISPITKQRAVMLMRSSGLEAQMAEECFMIIYPSSRADQFRRMWNSLSEKTTDSKQRFLDYAASKGVEKIAEKLIQKKMNECAIEVLNSGIGITTFRDVCDKASNHGVITSDYSDLAKSFVGEYVARSQMERSIGDDILLFAESDELIMRMVDSGNREGISDRIQITRSVEKTYADEIADEIVASFAVMRRMKLR